MPIELNIKSMDCWAPNAESPSAWSDWLNREITPHGDTPPPLTHIKPMQRRRLSLVARAAFHVGNGCLEHCDTETDRVASVFATTFGQVSATEKMLETIAEGRLISPTAFSLSVHNAIAGQFSIAHQLREPSMTIASGREGLGGIFLQAAGLLVDGQHSNVLVCCFEEPLAESFKPYSANPPTPMAAAFLLSMGGQSQAGTVKLSMTRHSLETEASGIPMWLQLLQFVAFLEADSADLSITSSSVNYHWVRHVSQR